MSKLTAEEYSKVMAIVARKSNYDTSLSLDYIYHVDAALNKLNLDLTKVLRLLNKAEDPDHLGRLVKETAGKRIYKKVYNEKAEDLSTLNKRRQKGASPFVKLDAGDVEHNTEFFNNAMGSSCEGGACTAESLEDKNALTESKRSRYETHLAKLKVEHKHTDPEVDDFYNHDTAKSIAINYPICLEYPFGGAYYADMAKLLANYRDIEDVIYYNTPGGPELAIKASPKTHIKFNIATGGDEEEFESWLADYVAKVNKRNDTDDTLDESIEDIEKEEKNIVPQTINIRQALNDIDNNSINSDFVNMYDAANLTKEDKQKLALMLAGQTDVNEIYDFLATKCSDNYLHSESHLTEDTDLDVCDWCGEDYDSSELVGTELGRICYKCQKALKSRGELNDDYDRDEPTLKDVANEFRVVGPAYRGAPQPAYDICAINESNIPDCMRFKSYDIEVTADDTIQLDYITQEEFTSIDSEKFIEEANNAFENIAHAIGYEKPFTVALNVRCRSGSSYGSLVYDLKIGE